jgi:hypothetical protein
MLGVFGPKRGKIGVYKPALIYQGPFKEGFSAGSPVINEVVLGTSVNKPSFCTLWTKIHRPFIVARYSTCVGSPAAATLVSCRLRSQRPSGSSK